MSDVRNVVIASACRTPIGGFMGSLSQVPAPKLGSIVIKEALNRCGVSPEQVDEVIMGCVLTANIGQAPARQAAIFAGLPNTVECMTINKVCGSGLKSVMLAAQTVALGDADIVVAGGMENMSQVPHYVGSSRTGIRLGHGELTDGLIKDGLWDVYNNFHMGNAAELCAQEHNITREEQDEFAAMSYRRSVKAVEEGLFAEEIVPVEIPQRKGDPVVVDTDEEPGRGVIEKFPKLRPAFDREGTVTAANASSINDGAATLVIMSEDKAKELNITPLATILGQASAAKAPEWFTTAPADAINKVLGKTGISLSDIDLFEINEAFAVVSIINNRLLKLDPDKVNVFGGGISLGHPLGASGARILVTLLHAMKKKDARKGLASLCIGGGEACAVVVKR